MISGVSEETCQVLDKANLENDVKLNELQRIEATYEFLLIIKKSDLIDIIIPKLYEGRVLSNFIPNKFLKKEIKPITDKKSLYLLNCTRKVLRSYTSVFNVVSWLPKEKVFKKVENIEVPRDFVRKGLFLYSFNVGQGNCSVINEIGTNDWYFIDFGGSVNYSNDILKLVRSLIRDGKNLHFLITHWDADHYRYLNQLNQNELRGLNIIAPYQPRVGIKCLKDIGFYFQNGAQIKLYEDLAFSDYICRYIRLDRYNFAQSPRSGKRYNKNNTGLILTIRYGEFNGLFPGDCEYSYITDDSEYDLIYVTHHGSRHFGREVPIAKEHNLALISYGQNQYGHPHPDAIIALQTYGWNLNDQLDYLIFIS